MYEVHRFADAIHTANAFSRETFVPEVAVTAPLPATPPTDEPRHPALDPVSRENHAKREQWTKDNPDIVVFMHALRVELLVNYVMRRIVPETEAEPFQYWLRFEFGTNTGNPHAHGMTYVAGTPNFECVVADEEAWAKLLARKHPEVLGQTLHDLRTWEEAEADLASFYDQYVRESHPAKEANGEPLYSFLIENLLLPGMARPQTVNLYVLLERTFATPSEPDLTELKTVLLALIEDGQRHTWHGHRVPTWGRDPCARKLRRRGEREQVLSLIHI